MSEGFTLEKLLKAKKRMEDVKPEPYGLYVDLDQFCDMFSVTKEKGEHDFPRINSPISKLKLVKAGVSNLE